MLPSAKMILWQKLDIDNVMSIQYLEFIAFASLSVLFSIATTVWSTVRIVDAH